MTESHLKEIERVAKLSNPWEETPICNRVLLDLLAEVQRLRKIEAAARNYDAEAMVAALEAKP